MNEDGDLIDIPYNPVAYEISTPEYLPSIESPKNNPLTVDGVELGRFLFYDPILSLDSTISCSSCHLPEGGFTDNLPVSPGVHGVLGVRSAMSLVNVGFNNNGLFWDGRADGLEAQALLPVEDPREMQETWPRVVEKLKRSDIYPEMFRKAFGIEDTKDIDRDLAAKALAQFQRTLISTNSKFDKWMRNEAVLTEQELRGFSMYIDDDPQLPDLQCDHCHSLSLATSNGYFNNGLQPAQTLKDFKDIGRGKVTGVEKHNGFFRAPTLRNWAYSAPFMHNGSLATMEEVLDHYASGGVYSPNKDPLLDDIEMTPESKEDLLAFLQTLNDEEFINNEKFKSPFK